MRYLLTIVILLLITGCSSAQVASGSTAYIDGIDNSGVFDKGHELSEPELKIIQGALRGAASDLKVANKQIKLLGEKIDIQSKAIDDKDEKIVELNKKLSEEKVFCLKIIIALIAVSVLFIVSVILNIKTFLL